MSILVTGGAGYIGSFVADAFAQAGHSVVILDDLSTGHFENTLGHDFVEGFVSDGDLIKDICGTYHVNTVVHLAGLSSVADSMQNQKAYLEADYFDTMRLGLAAYDCGIDRFIFASSAAAFCPQSSPYAMAKHLSEEFIQRRFESGTSLRLFNVAGATLYRGEKRLIETHLIPTVVAKKLCGDTSFYIHRALDSTDFDRGCVRDYVHVLDVADAFVQAYNFLDEGWQKPIFNVGTGIGTDPQTILQVYLGVPPEHIKYVAPRVGDMPYVVADSTHFLPKWGPKLTLKDIVDSTLAYQRRERNETT